MGEVELLLKSDFGEVGFWRSRILATSDFGEVGFWGSRILWGPDSGDGFLATDFWRNPLQPEQPIQRSGRTIMNN